MMKKILLAILLLTGFSGFAQSQSDSVNYIPMDRFVKIIENGKVKGLISLDGQVFNVSPTNDFSTVTISVGSSTVKCLVTRISVNSIACTSYTDLETKLSTSFPGHTSGGGGGGSGDASYAAQVIQSVKLDTIAQRILRGILDTAYQKRSISVNNFPAHDSTKDRIFQRVEVNNFPATSVHDSTKDRLYQYAEIRNFPAVQTVSGGVSAGLTDLVSSNPDQTTKGLPVRIVPQQKFRTTFSNVISNGVNPTFWSLITTGSGQTVNQTGGNLVLTTGTTANSETIIRSLFTFQDAFTMKYQFAASQRIANQNFVMELVDVIGDGLSFTVNSATSVTVTIPSNPFTSVNVGQGMYIGGISGLATAPPQRGVIASVSGNNVTYTVSGFPASGSGTCSVFGWNYYQSWYSGTTVTNMLFDAQKNGWNSGQTTATINTTASPGHMGIVSQEDAFLTFSDQLVASTTTLAVTPRASRVANVPDNTTLYLQIRSLNGSSAPASTTTWTVGFVSVENYIPQKVNLSGATPGSFGQPIPVQLVVNGVTYPFNLSQIGGQTIVNGGANGVLSFGGNIAIGTAATANPAPVGGRVQITTPTNLGTNGLTAGNTYSSNGGLITKSNASGENEWYNNGIITNTATNFQFRAAAGASTRNYVTAIILNSDALSPTTDLVILDGLSTAASQTISSNTLTTSAAHDLRIGDAVVFATSTVSGISTATTYYVLTVPSTTTLTLSATPNGSTLAISGTGVAGTLNRVLWRNKLQTSNLPLTVIPFATPLRGMPNATMSILTPTAVTGSVYYNITGYTSF